MKNIMNIFSQHDIPLALPFSQGEGALVINFSRKKNYQKYF
jgi:hypothetical protein